MRLQEECHGASFVDEIISIGANVCALIIVTYLGAVTRGHLSSSAPSKRMHLSLEILYFVAIFSTWMVMLGFILGISLCPSLGPRFKNNTMRMFCIFPGMNLLVISVLLTFVVRLYATFDKSAWRVSNTKICLCVIGIVIEEVNNIAGAVLYSIGLIGLKQLYTLLLISALIFITICCWTTYRFVRNLMALAKARAETISRNDLSNSEDICANQRRLVTLSSKYVTLFIIALVTSVLSFFLVAMCRIYWDVDTGFITSVDCVTNIVCLYLFQSFAAVHYKRYCSRLDDCCDKEMKDSVRMENIVSLSKRRGAAGSVVSPSASPCSSPIPASPTPAPPTSIKTEGDGTVIVYEPSVSAPPSPRSPSSSTGNVLV